MARARQSGFELLRIISMLLVVISHADFFSLGIPQPQDFSLNPIGTIGKIFFESLSICCVNVFVLISGWFGIKPSFSKFVRLIFQCLFFSFGLLLAALLLGVAPVGQLLGEIKSSLLLNDHWFITSYILLFFLAPVLNAFVETVSKKTFICVVACFFIYQTIYGWLISINGINEGYTTISFIGLYLLAKFIKKYPVRITQKKSYYYLLWYLGCAILNTLACIFLLNRGDTIYRLFYYISPLVILSSVCLTLAFSKMVFYNKTVNYVASSALAVYLFHTNHFVIAEFKRIVLNIYQQNASLLCLLKIAVFIVAVFAISVMIDQIRKLFAVVFERVFLFKQNDW